MTDMMLGCGHKDQRLHNVIIIITAILFEIDNVTLQGITHIM